LRSCEFLLDLAPTHVLASTPLTRAVCLRMCDASNQNWFETPHLFGRG
jgi:hypothetical protein